MNSLLQSLLAREQAQRNLERDMRGAELEEADTITAALHAAYEPFHEQILALKLRGDYGRAVAFGDRPDHLRRVTVERGLTLHLGSTLQPEVLKLTVLARQGGAPARIRLHVERHYPCKSEDLEDFPGGHSAQDMVQALLKAFASHVHDDSLPARAEVA